MALVALTDEQKQLLSDSTRFNNLVEWSMFNKARYWSQLDGSSVPGNDRVLWAKSRMLAVNDILRNFNIYGTYTKQFLILLTMPVYDNSVAFDADTAINYMITNSTFESLADLTFNEKIKGIVF